MELVSSPQSAGKSLHARGRSWGGRALDGHIPSPLASKRLKESLMDAKASSEKS